MKNGGIRYTRDQLIEQLSFQRGSKIPVTTFYKWLGYCGIAANHDYGYTESERVTLMRFCEHRCSHKSIKSFRQQLIQEQKEQLHHDDQNRTAGLFEHPITIEAQFVN